ncbi:MAG: hypothetical protein HY537_15505 [Deltaproteobacteria bacterium]|nr:hypothetical protein [Deltaproteobacteria bacterium]
MKNYFLLQSAGLSFLFASLVASAETLDKNYFEHHVLPALEKKCTRCHENSASSFEAALKVVKAGDPNGSELWRRAKGIDHEGTLQGDDLAKLEGWIKGATATASDAEPKGGAREGAALMGRVDATMEIPNGTFSAAQFDNKHFHVFLKAKASPKVSFMGEIVNATFFTVDFRPTSLVGFQFGKILVPFGDNTRFHYFYGGVGGLSTFRDNRMFANIWAAPGLNVRWNLFNTETVDTYVVQGLGTENGDPKLTSNDATTVAFGLRWTSSRISKVKLIGSALYEKWNPNASGMWIAGLNFNTDYGLVDVRLLKNFKINIGTALAVISEAASGSFKRYGDYFSLYTNLIPYGELRLRYGTYRYNWNVKSGNDTQGFNVAWLMPVDVLKFLFEYEWNFEAMNEVKNDVMRVMVALDF